MILCEEKINIVRYRSLRDRDCTEYCYSSLCRGKVLMKTSEALGQNKMKLNDIYKLRVKWIGLCSCLLYAEQTEKLSMKLSWKISHSICTVVVASYAYS